LGDRGSVLGRGRNSLLFATASRPALVLIQFHMKWVPGAFSVGMERPEREARHSPPSSVVVKNTWTYTSTIHTFSWRDS